jgi:hypothetical protein
MLFDQERHETLLPIEWDEARVRACIAHIVREAETQFSRDSYWPRHPRDLETGHDPTQPACPLYHGACGVFWALHYLQAVGAVRIASGYMGHLEKLLSRNRAWLRSFGSHDDASYMMGVTPILMLAYGHNPTSELADDLEALIAGNADNPTRELMWGAPGTLLAALFLHQHWGDERWARLYRDTAQKLWSQLQWSSEYNCHFWTQDMYGERSSYLDGVHGFVATASPLIRGRHLLGAETWANWEDTIVNIIERTAIWEGAQANWRPRLYSRNGERQRWLMQFCHGAPGFVACLADVPGTKLDALLVAGGEAVWAAGPLVKGSNLCHGTGGNGFAFLKLYRRTGDTTWLQRARAFAMHGIAQTEADARRYGQLHYSLWTGDLGFAIYLWNCLRGTAAFPTLDAFYV